MQSVARSPRAHTYIIMYRNRCHEASRQANVRKVRTSHLDNVCHVTMKGAKSGNIWFTKSGLMCLEVRTLRRFRGKKGRFTASWCELHEHLGAFSGVSVAEMMFPADRLPEVRTSFCLLLGAGANFGKIHLDDSKLHIWRVAFPNGTRRNYKRDVSLFQAGRVLLPDFTAEALARRLSS